MKVLPGMGWGDASGSVGALTVSHNRGGLYIRSRTVPTNPNTAFQSDVRAAVADLAQAWKTLTVSQQTQWSDFALSNPIVDVLGSTITLSGEQMYIRCNLRLSLYYLTTISVPPANMTANSPDNVGLAVDTAPAFAITFSTSSPADLYVRMTPPISPGIANFKKYLRTLGVFTQVTLGADVTIAYAARYGTPGAPTVGKLVGIELSGISQLNGQISVPLVSSAIIT